jgi:hypothetical protein
LSKYAEKVIALIDKYQLDQYDVPPNKWALDRSIVPETWYQAWAKAYGEEVKV